MCTAHTVRKQHLTREARSHKRTQCASHRLAREARLTKAMQVTNSVLNTLIGERVLMTKSSRARFCRRCDARSGARISAASRAARAELWTRPWRPRSASSFSVSHPPRPDRSGGRLEEDRDALRSVVGRLHRSGGEGSSTPVRIALAESESE